MVLAKKWQISAELVSKWLSRGVKWSSPARRVSCAREQHFFPSRSRTSNVNVKKFHVTLSRVALYFFLALNSALPGESCTTCFGQLLIVGHAGLHCQGVSGPSRTIVSVVSEDRRCPYTLSVIRSGSYVMAVYATMFAGYRTRRALRTWTTEISVG